MITIIEIWDNAYLDRPIHILQPKTKKSYEEWYPKWFDEYVCIRQQLYAQMLGWA